ncbi:polyprenyl synthetase family protein [uncultured Muribaculum sp.]|uniref:polyprenyl synthetase family protein n=1 Tax=uncultured Muribaculum sp. TaxID=1918613 RepID=UPI0025AA2BB3|nr:polyprenyl synthetase family protein [uncultured Muribaculum sp.]
MTVLEDIQHTIASELSQLNECMTEALSTSNELMNEIVGNYLKTKGKQIRPILVLLSAKLFGGITDATIDAAASIEMLHNASLIHDDVVDDTLTRRSRPTVNAIWDNHIAVLVGDFFVSSSLHNAVATGDLRIIDTISHLGRILSLGEIDQINKARYHDITEESYLEIIGSKTASLFVACIKMGGYSVNASDEDIERMCRFAQLFGLCFQIRDDIFDYFEDSRVGKPTGNDLREGKITLPLLHVLSIDTLPSHKEMNELVRNDELSSEQIATLIAYAREFGGIDYAYDCMSRFRDEAVEIINHFPDTEIRRSFISLFDFIIARHN